MLDIPTGLGWLYLDLNSYFASVEQQLNPQLRGKPVAVVPSDTEATCAIAASYEAKAYGVKTGTMIYQARKLCPGLVTVPARHDKYVEYHHKIMEQIDKHIPITKVCSIDEVACRLIGHEREKEKALEIARNIKKAILENVGPCLRSSVGIGPNRFLAKVASNLQKPDGLTVLYATELPDRLAHLKLSDLPGIGRNMDARLSRAGINDITCFWNLDPKHVRRIWHSVEGERFWYALHGIETTTNDDPTRRTVGHSHVLAPNMRPRHKARLVARRLTLKAASRLRRLGFFARNYSLYVRFDIPKGDGRKYKWQMDIKIPLAEDSFSFLRALNMLWQKMIEDNTPTHIKQLSVTFFGLVPAEKIMPDMFKQLDDPISKTQNRHSRLSVAMDDINKKYGLDTVVLGTLPETMAPFSGTKIAFTRIPEKAEFHE
ncbi:MAG: impB/mucB/samB family protein [Kordiimonadaceae bacterium]|nr:impB/mucB/samB family protein [Kordiimonadaceae bacterium]